MIWRKWIKYKGLSLVADELGVTYEAVRAWVNDGLRPSDSNKEKLVKMANGEFGFDDFFAKGK